MEGCFPEKGRYEKSKAVQGEELGKDVAVSGGLQSDPMGALKHQLHL